MRKRNVLKIALASVAALGISAVLIAGPGVGFKLTPATVQFRCNLGAACPGAVLDRIQGDGTAYPGQTTSQQGAYLDAGDDFYLVVTDKPRIFLDFSAGRVAVSGGLAPCTSGCPSAASLGAFWTTLTYPGLVIPVDPTTGGNLSGGLLQMTQGVPYEARLKLDFPGSDSTYFWTLRMNGGDGSDFVSVVRTSINTWRVTTAPGDPPAVAALYATTTARKQVTYPEGNYSMPFEMDVCLPMAGGTVCPQ